MLVDFPTHSIPSIVINNPDIWLILLIEHENMKQIQTVQSFELVITERVNKAKNQ